MIVNNLPIVGSSGLTKAAQPAAGATSFANTLETTMTAATRKTSGPAPTEPALQPDVATGASALLVDGESWPDAAQIAAGEDKHDAHKASDETPFIDPQIQQLQQLLAQASPPPVDGVTADAQASQADAVNTVTASQPASGPLDQPLMLDKRKESVVHATTEDARTDLNAVNTDNLFPAMPDRKTGEVGEKLTEQLKVGTDTSTQPLTKVAEVPQFHSQMVDSLKAVTQPATVDNVNTITQAASPAGSGVLNETLGTSAWQQSLGQQVTMFTRNGIHSAQLRLHPEELGAIQINLRLSNEHAQLHFVTDNAQVRAAVEAAMPHLRSSLAESGIHLGQSSVGADASPSEGFFSQSDQDKPPHQTEAVLASDDTQEAPPRAISRALGINTFV